MNTIAPAESTTVAHLIQNSFAKDGVVDAMPIEANGIIIGGMFVVKGEHAYDRIRALFEAPKTTAK